MLSVKAGEAGLIRVPAEAMERLSEAIDELPPADPLVGVFSREQLRAILDGFSLSRAVVQPVDLGSLVGSGLELKFEGVQAEQFTDLSVSVHERTEEGAVSKYQTGVTVFNGHALLLRTPLSGGGVVVLVGSDDP